MVKQKLRIRVKKTTTETDNETDKEQCESCTHEQNESTEDRPKGSVWKENTVFCVFPETFLATVIKRKKTAGYEEFSRKKKILIEK